MTERAARETVVRTAQMMARAGLAEAFGHVSARLGDGFAITSTLPFMAAGPDDVVMVPDVSNPPSGGGGAPLETPMHAAIYLARPDVGAICRGHPPSVVTWGVGTENLPLLHGLGALAGRRVGVSPEVDLICTMSQGTAVADVLGADHAIVLRANGCLAVGTTPLEALTRLYFLEERARVAISPPGGREENDWEARLRHAPAEMLRAMAWVEATFGRAGDPDLARKPQPRNHTY